MNINPNRPLERLVGDNAARVRFKVGKLHVATSYMDVYRAVIRPLIKQAKRKRKRGWARYPAALRRGLVLYCYEQHAQNFKLYRDVMSGNSG